MHPLQERRPESALSASGADGHRRGRRRVVAAAVTAALVVAADQLAKALVLDRIEPGEVIDLGPVHLVRAFNTGMAFSLGRGRPGLVVVIVALVVGLVWFARRELTRPTGADRSSLLPALAFGLLIGGAVGNLADRLLRSPGIGRGAVVDFIDVKGFLDFWPVFNIADIALTVGSVLLILLTSWGPAEAQGATTSGDPERSSAETGPGGSGAADGLIPRDGRP